MEEIRMLTLYKCRILVVLKPIYSIFYEILHNVLYVEPFIFILTILLLCARASLV